MWYEQGVVIDGCKRQPIAAVRSESSVRSIMPFSDVMLASSVIMPCKLAVSRELLRFLILV